MWRTDSHKANHDTRQSSIHHVQARTIQLKPDSNRIIRVTKSIISVSDVWFCLQIYQRPDICLWGPN